MTRATLEEMLAINSVELRVGRDTAPPSLATAMLRFQEEGKRPHLSIIGPEACWVGMKAIAIANGESAQQGSLLVAYPSFDLKRFPDKRQPSQSVEMTALKMIVGRIPIVL